MYTSEQKIKAVELYIKYDLRPGPVMVELGYPKSRVSLRAWWREYLENDGEIHEGYKSKYTSEQRAVAVAYYLEHGRSVSSTRRALGFPDCDDVLIRWIDADAPAARRTVKRGSKDLPYDEKVDAVVALETRDSSASLLAESLGTDRNALYRWRRQLLGKGAPLKMSGKTAGKRSEGDLVARIAELEEQVRELELRRAILEGTIELLGKDPGADPNRLTNKEKTILIESLRPKWKLRELLLRY